MKTFKLYCFHISMKIFTLMQQRIAFGYIMIHRQSRQIIISLSMQIPTNLRKFILPNCPSTTSILSNPSSHPIPPIPRLFTQPTHISKHLYCTVCLQVFLSPCRLNCGHTFCEHCILNLIENSLVDCPECRQTINLVFIGEDLLARGIVEELEVVCGKRQCAWKGMCKDLGNHTNLQCMFKESNEIRTDYETDDDMLKQKLYQNIPHGSLIGRILNKNTALKSQATETQPTAQQNPLSKYLDELF